MYLCIITACIIHTVCRHVSAAVPAGAALHPACHMAPGSASAHERPGQMHNRSLYVSVSLCVYMYIDIHLHTYIHTFIHSYIHTYIHSFIHTYIHSYIHSYIHTYIHTHIRTYLYTHVQYNTIQYIPFHCIALNCIALHYIYTYICYICTYIYIHMDACMDGWMDACMCMTIVFLLIYLHAAQSFFALLAGQDPFVSRPSPSRNFLAMGLFQFQSKKSLEQHMAYTAACKNWDNMELAIAQASSVVSPCDRAASGRTDSVSEAKHHIHGSHRLLTIGDNVEFCH